MEAEVRELTARWTAGLDRIVAWVSWVWLALIGVIVGGVVLRVAFGIGRIELEELQWHLYAIGFLFGIVGCVARDRHVRVDVLRERFAPRTRDWIELYGVLLLQIPLVALVLWSAVPLVIESYLTAERSASAGGLPSRFVLRAVLPLSFGLLGLASLLRLLEVASRLFGDREAGAPTARRMRRGGSERG